jgi:katanin p60 ATPase-containing subunit A1
MKLLDVALKKEYVSNKFSNDLLDIPLPTEKGRLELFKINLRGIQLSEEHSIVDWPKLVSLTEGYSGADISNVCRDAAMMPMRRKLLSSHFDINNLHNMQEEIDVPLTMEDFLEALKNISKSVSQDQLTAYSEWMK